MRKEDMGCRWQYTNLGYNNFQVSPLRKGATASGQYAWAWQSQIAYAVPHPRHRWGTWAQSRFVA